MLDTGRYSRSAAIENALHDRQMVVVVLGDEVNERRRNCGGVLTGKETAEDAEDLVVVTKIRGLAEECGDVFTAETGEGAEVFGQDTRDLVM